MTDSILPSLDAIQARADTATDGPWDYYCTHHPSGRHAVYIDSGMGTQDVAVEAVEPDAVFIAAARTDVPVLVAALRAVLDTLGPHWDEQVRRESRFGRTESSCVCYGCNAIRAVTAHIDTTKEKP